MSTNRIVVMLRCESLILETYSASCQSTFGQKLCLEYTLGNNLTETTNAVAFGLEEVQVDDFLHRYSSTFNYPLVIDERKIKLGGNVAALSWPYLKIPLHQFILVCNLKV